jgi:hypothetical protein
MLTVGVALFSVMTAYLSSVFVPRVQAAPDQTELRAELAELRRVIVELQATVAGTRGEAPPEGEGRPTT